MGLGDGLGPGDGIGPGDGPGVNPGIQAAFGTKHVDTRNETIVIQEAKKRTAVKIGPVDVYQTKEEMPSLWSKHGDVVGCATCSPHEADIVPVCFPQQPTLVVISPNVPNIPGERQLAVSDQSAENMRAVPVRPCG